MEKHGKFYGKWEKDRVMEVVREGFGSSDKCRRPLEFLRGSRIFKPGC